MAALPGAVTTRPFPNTDLRDGRRRVYIEWRYADVDFSVRGEGLIRLAPPDSARLDFFLAGGYGGGRAVLLGDSLVMPNGNGLSRFLPPPALLWATLGRLTVQGADTILRVDGDTLRADIGAAPRWRAAFVDDRLVRLEHIDDERLREYVHRGDSASVRYEHAAPRRRLEITILRSEPSAEFDADIWR